MNDTNFGGVEYITSTGVDFIYSAGTATSASIEPVTRPALHKSTTSPRKIQNAVYAHLRALRSVGKTQVAVGEIASALSLPETVVVNALAALRGKGVKVRKP